MPFPHSRRFSRWGLWLVVAGLIGAVVAVLPAFSSRVPSPAPIVRLAATATSPRKDDTATPKAPLMSAAEREFLWQVEHHFNLLGQHGFAALASALKRSDAPALRKSMAAGFRGRYPEHAREVVHEGPGIQVIRSQGNGDSGADLDPDGFIKQLLRLRATFRRAPMVKVSVMALAPLVRDNLDGEWSGTCLLRMWGETAEGGPGEVALHLHYRLDRPTEAAFARGGWLRRAEIRQSLVSQSPRPLMREVAAERGIDVERFHDNWKHKPTRPVTGGVYLCDYDRDGRIDVLLTDVLSHVLYRGLPEGKFADVTRDVGLLPPPSSMNSMFMGELRIAAFGDLDGDGWEDLIIGPMVYRNEEGQHFTLVATQTNFHLPFAASGITVADFDRDGKVDLYVTALGRGKADNWLSGRGGGQPSNFLYRNLGNWQFQDVTIPSGAGGGDRSSFSVAWLDADDDGWPDLYVPNEFGEGALLVNQHDGRFVEHSLVDRPSDFGTMGVAAGDVDNDGRIDIYAANMYSKAGNRVIGNVRPGTYPEEIMARMRTYSTGSQLHRNRGGLSFEKKGAEWQVADVGWAYGAALVDLDNDGWLDIYATCGYISQDRSKPDG